MSRPEDLQVHLTVDDARTVQAAGVKFALARSGAHSQDFALALDEQQHLVERAIAETGHSVDQAQLAAGHFGAAARDEWERLVNASSADTWGQA